MTQTFVIDSPLIKQSPLPEDKLPKGPQNLWLSGRIRYNLIINIFIILIVGLPFFVPTYITLAINLYYAFIWIFFILLATMTQIRIKTRLARANSQKLAHKPKTDLEDQGGVTKKKLKLIMATFVYKEPLKLILATLKNLSEQKMAQEIIMVVGMEERTPEKEKKIDQVISSYGKSFKQLVITVHPYGTPGEIPGKCSNCNYALRSIVNHLKTQDPHFNPEEYIVTNFDVDTIFHPRFLEIQQDTVLQEKDISNIVWQPVLYYNWGLDKLSCFTRITGLVRNAMMMGALIPLNINIMSVYTASLKLYIDGEYTHPAYQMDDIICYIRWLTVTKRDILIKPIYCPTISGPTSGSSFMSEMSEWVRQIRRWSVGSAEVFHYFCIKAKRIGIFRAFLWGMNYLNYYAGFLCAQALLIFSTSIATAVRSEDSLTTEFRLLFLIPLVIVYSCLLWVMILNSLAVKYMLNEMGVIEDISVVRNVFDWIASFFVMIAYSLVVIYGFFEILVFGRKVCKHGASKKSDLQVEQKKISSPVGSPLSTKI